MVVLQDIRYGSYFTRAVWQETEKLTDGCSRSEDVQMVIRDRKWLPALQWEQKRWWIWSDYGCCRGSLTVFALAVTIYRYKGNHCPGRRRSVSLQLTSCFVVVADRWSAPKRKQQADVWTSREMWWAAIFPSDSHLGWSPLIGFH